jgi:type IV pilus assembly protein PilB
MVDMGIEPFNVASAVNLITAQRLVRRICSKCKETVTYPDEYIAAAQLGDDAKDVTFYRGKGCEDCGGSGYRGRQGLYEVMAMSPTLRRMILQGASTADLSDQAVAEGMLTLRMDGWLKIRKGITTLEEVLKETAG